MGYRDPHLTPDELLAAAEYETRRMLARYGEPMPLVPPVDLADRVIGALAASSLSPPPPKSRLRRTYGLVIGVGLVILLALGSWGVLFDSGGPARLFGDLSGGLSQFLLLLTLTAKPLINLLFSAGLMVFFIFMAIVGGSWLWWQLLHYEIATSLETPA